MNVPSDALTDGGERLAAWNLGADARKRDEHSLLEHSGDLATRRHRSRRSTADTGSPCDFFPMNGTAERMSGETAAVNGEVRASA
jgi:hypothetical protein